MSTGVFRRRPLLQSLPSARMRQTLLLDLLSAVAAGGGGSGLVLDAPSVTTFAATAQTSQSRAVTIASNANRLLLVSLGAGGPTSVAFTSVQFNGVSMTLVASTNDGDQRHETYALINPPNGTFNLTFNLTPSAADVCGLALCLHNADQVQPYATALTNTTALPSTDVGVSAFGYSNAYPIVFRHDRAFGSDPDNVSLAGQTRVATSPNAVNTGSQNMLADTATVDVGNSNVRGFTSDNNSGHMSVHFAMIRARSSWVIGAPNGAAGGFWSNVNGSFSTGSPVDGLPAPAVFTATTATGRRSTSLDTDWRNGNTYYFRLRLAFTGGAFVYFHLDDGVGTTTIQYNAGTETIESSTSGAGTIGAVTITYPTANYGELIIPITAIRNAGSIVFGFGPGETVNPRNLYEYGLFTYLP